MEKVYALSYSLHTCSECWNAAGLIISIILVFAFVAVGLVMYLPHIETMF